MTLITSNMYYAEVHHHPIVEPAYPINVNQGRSIIITTGLDLKVLGVIGMVLEFKKMYADDIIARF